MPSRQPYARLPQQDDNELEAAFESDDETTDDTSALIGRTASHPVGIEHDGVYNFEPRFEDYAAQVPEGSPPTVAGNSNGLLPGPPAVPKPPSWLVQTLGRFRRTGTAHARTIGRGNDGVFGNVVAKPNASITASNDVHASVEDARSDVPPNYAVAMADPAPTYWEVHAPGAPSVSIPGELMVDDMPSGSIMMFIWSAFVTTSFAWVGLFLAYILNKTSHAGRHGSRAGLGLWLMRFGYDLYVQQAAVEELDDNWHWDVVNGTMRLVHGDADGVVTPATLDEMQTIAFRSAMNGWVAIILLFVGSTVLSISIGQFIKVKHYEAAVLRSTLPQDSTIRNVASREQPSTLQALGQSFRERFVRHSRRDSDEEEIAGSIFPGQGRRLDGRSSSVDS